MAGKSKQSYLFAVQRASGHEVVSVTVEGATPAVTAQHMENGLVRLVRDGDVIAEGGQVIEDQSETLTLYRWKADDKLGEPTSSEVARV